MTFRTKVVSHNLYSFNIGDYILRTHGNIFMNKIRDSKVIFTYLEEKEIINLKKRLIKINRHVLYDGKSETFYVVSAKYPNHRDKYLNILRHLGVTRFVEEGDAHIVFKELNSLSKNIAKLNPKRIVFTFLNNLTDVSKQKLQIVMHNFDGFQVGVNSQDDSAFIDIASVYGWLIFSFLNYLLKDCSPESIDFFGVVGGLLIDPLYKFVDVGVARSINSDNTEIIDAAGTTCMSVNSVFDETQENIHQWLREGVKIVDQELFHFFSAINERKYKGKVTAKVLVTDLCVGKVVANLNQDRIDLIFNDFFQN